MPNAGWDAWVAGFKGRAAARGLSQGAIDAAFRGAGFLPEVIEKDRNQTEFGRDAYRKPEVMELDRSAFKRHFDI